MTNFEFLRERLLARIPETSTPPKYDWQKLNRSEWSEKFEQLMRNRMLIGALRYGPLEHKRKVGAKWDLIGAIEKKIHAYKKTGNTEYLVDIANYCLIEFECGYHPTKHFTALDDHSDHCKEK